MITLHDGKRGGSEEFIYLGRSPRKLQCIPGDPKQR